MHLLNGIQRIVMDLYIACDNHK